MLWRQSGLIVGPPSPITRRVGHEAQATSHTRSVWSKEADTRRVPSGD